MCSLHRKNKTNTQSGIQDYVHFLAETVNTYWWKFELLIFVWIQVWTVSVKYKLCFTWSSNLSVSVFSRTLPHKNICAGHNKLHVSLIPKFSFKAYFSHVCKEKQVKLIAVWYNTYCTTNFATNFSLCHCGQIDKIQHLQEKS